MTSPAAQDAGFTLIEVLTALVILAVAAGFAFNTVSGGFAWLSQADLEQQAATSAATVLARLGHDIAVHPARINGKDGRLNWLVEIGAALTDPLPADGVAAYPVTVTIEWQDRAMARKFRVQSVRLGPEDSAP